LNSDLYIKAPVTDVSIHIHAHACIRVTIHTVTHLKICAYRDTDTQTSGHDLDTQACTATVV